MSNETYDEEVSELLQFHENCAEILFWAQIFTGVIGISANFWCMRLVWKERTKSPAAVCLFGKRDFLKIYCILYENDRF